MINYLSKIIFFIVSLVISGSIINLLKDGGARDEGPANAVIYVGLLNSSGAIAKLLMIAFILIVAKKYKIFISFKEIVFIFYVNIVSIFSSDISDAVSQSLGVSLIFVYTRAFVYFFGSEEAKKIFFYYCSGIMLASLVFVVLLPSYGVSVGLHDGRWQGVFDHKNGLGGFCAIAAIFFLDQYFNSKNKLALFFWMASIFVAIKTESFTGISSAIISSFVYMALNLLGRINFIVLKVNYVIIGLVFVAYGISFYDVQIDFFGKDASFSGRNVIWGDAIHRCLDNIFFGNGVGQIYYEYENFSDEYLGRYGFFVSSTHSGYIDLLYSLGIFGVIILLVIFFEYKKILSQSKNYYFMISFFSGFFLLNTFESRLMGWNFYYFSAVFVINICICDKSKI